MFEECFKISFPSFRFVFRVVHSAVFGCMLAQASPAIVESETTLMFADSAFNRSSLIGRVNSVWLISTAVPDTMYTKRSVLNVVTSTLEPQDDLLKAESANMRVVSDSTMAGLAWASMQPNTAEWTTLNTNLKLGNEILKHSSNILNSALKNAVRTL